MNTKGSNGPISAGIIHYTPMPKTFPFFIGPPIIPNSEDEDEFLQSLPHESLVVLSESTSEIEPEMTPEPQEENLFRDWHKGRESSNCGGNNVADLLITGRVSRCRKS